MSKKYIYAKKNIDDPFLVRENEFHFLCKFLGVYLKYEKEKEFFDNFEDYLQKYNIKEQIIKNTCWSYVNEAQKYIRDKLNDVTEANNINSRNTSKVHVFSKREIRKLGYYGTISTPAIPKSACEIETELFNTIFDNKTFKEVADSFNDYLFASWESNQNRANYFTAENPNALNVTTTYFIGFQQRVINDNPAKNKKFFAVFKSNSGYNYIQDGLDKRHC